MSNYMAEVAKMLGVELGEEFEIHTSDDKILVGRFTKIDLVVKSSSINLKYDANMIVLHELLVGTYTIRRKPWKPKREDWYWNVQPDGEFALVKWTDETADYNNYKLGNCYKTKEDANSNRSKWVLFYASDEVLEV